MRHIVLAETEVTVGITPSSGVPELKVKALPHVVSTPTLVHPLAQYAGTVTHLGGHRWRLGGVLGFRLAEHCEQYSIEPPEPLLPERTYTVELRGW